MKNIYTTFAIALLFTTAASSAFAQVVDYRILINGTEAAVHNLSAGVHSFRVEARVSNNDLTGGGVNGGLLQSAFDLTDSVDAIVWEDVLGGFIGGPDGNWDSSTNAAFDTVFQGTLINSGTTVIAETGSIAPGDFNDDFGVVGANMYSFISEGNFNWNGTDTTIDLTVANLQLDVLVAALSGGNVVAVAAAEGINFASTTLTQIPEPGTLALASLGLIGIVASRRRRQR